MKNECSYRSWYTKNHDKNNVATTRCTGIDAPNTTNTIVCILLLRQIVWDGRIESWRNTVRVEVHSSSSSSRRGSITNLD